MYTFGNANRRDRRARKHKQVAPFLTANEVAVKVAEAAADAQEAEETRRMLELRELDQAVQAIRPQIEAYLQTAHGKEELKAVVREMHRLREQHKQAHPAAAEEARLLELAKKEAGDNGTPAERLLHELEKKEKVRAIFEVFDADGSDAMDAGELAELMKELLLPCSEEDVEEYMEEMDEDGSGEIDFEEFYAWYNEHADTMKKGHGLAVLGLKWARYRNHGLGLADLGEARRVVISHAEHEAKERALHQFRLFRPPNVEALAKSPFFEPPESDATKAKRHERFAPVTNLLYAEGIEARKYRLRRLGFSHSLYTPKTTLDDLPVRENPVAAPSIGDGGTNRRAAQWANGQSVEGMDPSRGKRAEPKRLSLRSIRTPLAKSWAMTRQVHPTFALMHAPTTGSGGEGGDGGIGGEGGMVVRKGKRVRLMAPLMNKPLAARLLNREQHNNDRLARVDLSNYPAGSAMRAGLPPSMADLLARLSHDLVEVGDKKKKPIGGGGGGGSFGQERDVNSQKEEEEEEGGALRYIPVGDTRAKIEFIWRKPVKKCVFLCVDGWNRDEDMLPNQVTQSYSAVRYLPAGRYTYRFKVDGRYLLDPLSPTSGTLGSPGFQDPSLMRNLVIVVPHSTEPHEDATRKPITTVDLPQKSLGDDGAWVLRQALLKNRSVTVLNLQTNFISTDGACALGGLLAERPSMLVRLNLGGNGIGYDGCLAIALGLQKNHSLTSLELPRNRVGDDGCDALASGLEGHRALLNLELSNNFVHCDGLEDLCRSLVKNNSLVRLGLNDNYIGLRGIDAACTLLRSNQRLRDLCLNHNPSIGPQGAIKLGSLLGDPDCVLEGLALSGCSLMDTPGEPLYAPKEGMHLFAIGIARNASLRSLSLASNGINNWGARELATALQENTTIVSMDLEGNPMDDEWYQPAHTMHTDADPSVRSIASSVLRNGELAAHPPPLWPHPAEPPGARKWDALSGAPGMVVITGNRGDQAGAIKAKKRAQQLEKKRAAHYQKQEQRRIAKATKLAQAKAAQRKAAAEAKQRGRRRKRGASSSSSTSSPNSKGDWGPESLSEGEDDAGMGETKLEDFLSSEDDGGSFEEGHDDDDSDEEDEATLAEALFAPGEERNFVAPAAADPLDVVARYRKMAKRNEQGVQGSDGVWRDEGQWAPRCSPAPGEPELAPRWLTVRGAAAEEEQRREVRESRAEKLRIRDENACIEAALAQAEAELPLFLHGKPCSLEKQRGLGKKLVKSLAVNVLAYDRVQKEKNRNRARQNLIHKSNTMSGQLKELAVRKVFAFDQANRREDMQALFDSFDLDCSGCIDINELGVVVEALCGFKLSHEEVTHLSHSLDEDGSGEVGFQEFYAWHARGGVAMLIANGPPGRKAWAEAKKLTSQLFSSSGGGGSSSSSSGGGSGGSDDKEHKIKNSSSSTRVSGATSSKALKARSERTWKAVLLHLTEKRSRAVFRLKRPPRRGCVCPSTGFAFPSSWDLAEHNTLFNFTAFHDRSRKFSALERMVERARQAIGAVPEWPKVLCFAAHVPVFVELTAYDVANVKFGRPVGVVRIADVVRALDGLKGTPWIKVALPSAPDGAWVFNQTPRYDPVLVPLEFGNPPVPDEANNDDDDDVSDSSDDDDDDVSNDVSSSRKKQGGSSQRPPKPPSSSSQSKRAATANAKPPPPPPPPPSSKARGKASPPPPPPMMTWYDDGDPLTPQAWFRADPYLPSGAVLKIRTRPAANAQIVLGLELGYAVRAVCSCGDWLMVAYTAPDPSPTAKAGATVRMEGWMLMRTQTRVLLVAVQDPGLLDHLSYSPVSPAQLVDPLQLPSAAGGFGNGMSGGAEDDDSSSDDEEEMAIEQKRAMKKAMKDLKKENKGK